MLRLLLPPLLLLLRLAALLVLLGGAGARAQGVEVSTLGLNRQDGITLMIVTHEADIAQYADRLIRLVDGRIDYDGPARAYFQERAA